MKRYKIRVWSLEGSVIFSACKNTPMTQTLLYLFVLPQKLNDKEGERVGAKLASTSTKSCTL